MRFGITRHNSACDGHWNGLDGAVGSLCMVKLIHRFVPCSQSCSWQSKRILASCGPRVWDQPISTNQHHKRFCYGAETQVWLYLYIANACTNQPRFEGCIIISLPKVSAVVRREWKFVVLDKLPLANHSNPVSGPPTSGPEAVRLEILTLIVETVSHSSTQFMHMYQGLRTSHRVLVPYCVRSYRSSKISEMSVKSAKSGRVISVTSALEARTL